MGDYKFDFQGFEPRAGVREFFDNSLCQFLEIVPGLQDCRAVVANHSRCFEFSVVIKTSLGIFSSQATLSKESTRGRPRAWQTSLIARILRDLESQIQRRKKVDPKEHTDTNDTEL